MVAGEGISSFVTPAVPEPWLAVGTKEMVKDWAGKVELLEDTGSAGGLGMSHTVALEGTGFEGRWMNVGLFHCELREGNQPYARVLMKGYTENPTMGASFPGGLHLASLSEVRREPPSMMGLHAAGIVKANSWQVDVLFGGLTAERTATWMTDPGTSYAATSCKKGVLPGGHLVRYAFYPRHMDTGAFQMNSKVSVDSFEDSQNCPLNLRKIYCCCHN